MTGPGLAARQAQLIAALTAGAPVPPGFDAQLVDAARAALLDKRAREVARHWPMLAAGLGPAWLPTLRRWAATRAGAGGLRDGWDLARELATAGALTDPAADELSWREVHWRYDGRSTPRPRRGPAARRVGTVLLVQVAGRTHRWRLPGR